MNLSSIPLPDNYNMLNEETQSLVIEYISHLSDIEKKAYKIAKAHLGSSFNIVKSNGFNDWLKSRKLSQTTNSI